MLVVLLNAVWNVDTRLFVWIVESTFQTISRDLQMSNNGKRNILSFYSQKRTTKLGVPLQCSVLQKHKVDGANNEWWINSGINPT